MWFAGASASFPGPCPYPLLGHPSINAAWHRLLRKMTFATEAVLTTLTRDGRADRQMNRRSDAAAFDGMEERERKITWRKEMGREGRASPLILLCSQRILDQKVVHRSLARSFVPSFLPHSPLFLFTPHFLSRSPSFSLVLSFSAFSTVAAFRLSLRKPPAQRTNERATLPLAPESIAAAAAGQKKRLNDRRSVWKGGRVRLVITT